MQTANVCSSSSLQEGEGEGENGEWDVVRCDEWDVVAVTTLPCPPLLKPRRAGADEPHKRQMLISKAGRLSVAPNAAAKRSHNEPYVLTTLASKQRTQTGHPRY